MRFTPKQIVAVVVAVCAAAVLTPVAVGAATGQIVNIADFAIAGRHARVGTSGTLYVEQRAGVQNGAFAVHGSRLGIGWIPLVNAQLPQKIAVTELTITPQGPDGYQVFRIEAWIRKGSTGSCNAPNLSEFTKVVLRQVSARNYETITLDFSGTPLYVPQAPPAGQFTCLGVVSIQMPNGSESSAGATGYRYVP